MKRVLLFVLFTAARYVSMCQDHTTDSLARLLPAEKEPIKRFGLIVKISESRLVMHGAAGDSLHAIELLRIAEELKSDSLLAISYNWIGSYFAFTKGDNATGLEYCFKALPLAEKARDERRMCSLYFDIAQMYFSLQNDEAGFKNVMLGGEHLSRINASMHDFMLVQYQNILTRYYLAIGKTDSALQYAQALLATSRIVKSSQFEFYGLLQNAIGHALAKDHDLAAVYFTKAKDLLGSIGLNSPKLVYFKSFGNWLLQQRKFLPAKQQGEILFQSGITAQNQDMVLAGATLLSEAFDSLGRVDSAYFYLKRSADVNAEIFSQNNINKVQALAFDEQVRKMEQTALDKEQDERRKANLQYVLISFAIIGLIVLYLFLSRSFITNPRIIEFLGVVATLIVFEFFNLLLHPFLERITNHTPVLMLLALVLIAAVIVPVHHKIEKWVTQKMVEKNKAIRLAVAKKTLQELGAD